MSNKINPNAAASITRAEQEAFLCEPLEAASESLSLPVSQFIAMRDLNCDGDSDSLADRWFKQARYIFQEFVRRLLCLTVSIVDH